MDEKRLQQMAFNGAWRGLKWQGFQRSMRSGGDGCATRAVALSGPNRRCCALGWLIPDAATDKVDMELWPRRGLLADVLFVATRHPLCSASDLTSFASDLVDCHDMGTTPAEMKRRLLGFAHHYGLMVPND